MRIFSVVFILFFLVLPSHGQGLGHEIRAKQKELDEIEKQLKESREKSEYFSDKEGDMLQQLQRLQKQIDQARSEKLRLQNAVKKAEEDVETLDERGARLSEKQKKLTLFLNSVFYQSFLNWRKAAMEPLMPGTAVQSGRDRFLLSVLGHFNYYILKENIETMEELGLVRVEKAEVLERFTLHLLSAKVAEKKLVRLDKEKSNALSSIRSKKTYYTQLESELKKQKDALTGLIRDLEKKGSTYDAGVRFADLKGVLAWPAQGNVYKNFGKNIDSVYKTVLTNDGIDIAAPFQSPVRAVAGGKVIYSRPFKSLGTMVILDHGENYFTIYSNLYSAGVQEGDLVSPRDVLGSAGRDILSDTALIHFEIRKEARPLSPLEWLSPSK
ncbi:MAG TPA: hypothetical protein ENN72_09040 [Firmicutes bacterium]|nr:hypothetical protein [Bacillota bacterium]